MYIYFGLGSNITNELGDPLWHLQQAVQALSQLGIVTVSSLYKSVPFGVTDQPDFFNAVARVELTQANAKKYSPLQLLEFTQSIEHAGKREKLRHWGERSIDVDILLYANMLVNEINLTVPHIGILERNFVSVPMYEIDAALHIPVGNDEFVALAQQAIAHDMTGLEIVSHDWL